MTLYLLAHCNTIYDSADTGIETVSCTLVVFTPLAIEVRRTAVKENISMSINFDFFFFLFVHVFRIFKRAISLRWF